jgi:acetyltransferase-like isoleucine patch superfamily enzyme
MSDVVEYRADHPGDSVIIDPQAHVADSARIGTPYRPLQEGEWERRNRPTKIAAHCKIGHFCVIGAEVVTGERCIFDSYTSVGGGATIGNDVMVIHRATIGARAEIADGCVIAGLIGERSKVGQSCRIFGDLVHRQLDPTRPWDGPESMEPSPVLAEQVFIGWRAIVIGGVTVGRGAYVCAGATVTRDVPAGVIVTGTNQFCQPEHWKGALGKTEFFASRLGPEGTDTAPRNLGPAVSIE